MEGRWVQTRLYDIGWSDDKKGRGCGTMKMARRCTGKRPSSVTEGSQKPDPGRKWEQRASTFEKDRKWQRDITSHPQSENSWRTNPSVGPQVGIGKGEKLGYVSLKASVTMSPDGSFLGVPGGWRACGNSVAQLNHDKEVGQCMECTER